MADYIRRTLVSGCEHVADSAFDGDFNAFPEIAEPHFSRPAIKEPKTGTAVNTRQTCCGQAVASEPCDKNDHQRREKKPELRHNWGRHLD
jgi:hypothetical protein